MRYNKYNHSFIYIVLKNIRKSISKFNKPYQNHDLLYLQPHPTIYITHHKPHRGFAFDRAGLARETSLPCQNHCNKTTPSVLRFLLMI